MPAGKGELRGETGRGIDMGEEAATGSGELGKKKELCSTVAVEVSVR